MEDLGSLLVKQNKYEEAEPLLRESVRQRRALLGDQHPETAESLYALDGMTDEGADIAHAIRSRSKGRKGGGG